MKDLRLPIVAALLIGWAMTAHAAESYRYINDKGNVVLDHYIPPEYLDRGYDVVGPDGRLIRRVPAQSELAARAAAAAAAESARGREAEAIASDQDLLRQYRSVDEVERARDRKLESLERALGVERANVERLKTQKRNYELHGAELERGGAPVPATLVSDLHSVTGQLRDREQLIAARTNERVRTELEFNQAIVRFKALRGG